MKYGKEVMANMWLSFSFHPHIFYSEDSKIYAWHGC